MSLLRRTALRACLTWVLVHAIFFLLSDGEVVRLSLRALVLLALFAAAVGIADSRRRQEFLFLMNMGVPGSTVPLTWVASIVALEGILRLATGLVS